MQYSQLAEIYEKLEATAKKLEKRDILSGFYKKCPKDELHSVVLLSIGVVFPQGQLDLGLAKETVRRIIAKTYGIPENKVIEKFKQTGDLGLTAEFFSQNRRQFSLASKSLTVEHVFENLRKLPEISGQGSVERKISLVSELLSHASPVEACYIVRTILGDMRIGVAEGIVRDAIAQAFEKEKKDVERLFDVVGNYGQVAIMAKKGKMKADIVVGSPLRVMLADRAESLKEAIEKFENPACEIKYDGFRIQAHSDGRNIRIFSRRMEDVTKQFPDIVKLCRENIAARNYIVEAEALAVDKKGQPLPFQLLSRRIQRKYDIEKTVKEIPVQLNFFDLLYLNKKSCIEEPFKERWQKLKTIIRQTEKIRLADHLETKDLNEANKFYKKSLSMNQEGVIVKNLDAKYQPGKRVGYWLKVKDILEPLDLVVVGGQWGEGKRTKWIGSLILAARKGDDFVETARMASGLTEAQMEDLTKILKPLITHEEGKLVKVKPHVVVEIGYEEIQKSPKYPSGLALRFPRLLRIRDDKKPEDANTIEEVENFFEAQSGKRKKP